MSLAIDDRKALARYRQVYGLGSEIDASHVRRHEALERELTQTLLGSSEQSRWADFETAYTRLYSELPWLNATPEATADGLEPRVQSWRFLVAARAKIYEVGSGRARLLRFLHSIGCECVATEITRERGQRHANDADGLTWRNSDGIHLTQFEPSQDYDCVISTQVVEHMHPEDLPTHFAQALQLLKSGGTYIFDTPHRSCGPHDLSRVFELDRAEYMHLKEYTWVELHAMLLKAGYSRVQAIFQLPGLAARGCIAPSSIYLRYLMLWDWLEDRLALPAPARRRLRKWLRWALVPSNVWLQATR